MKTVSRHSWIITLTTVLVLLTTICSAMVLPEHEVISAVETWVRYGTADARPDAYITEIEPYIEDGEILAYITHLSGGGFCLCGADDIVLPVYLYSPSAIFESNNPDLQIILKEITDRTRILRDGLSAGSPEITRYEDALSLRASYWQDLATGHVPEMSGRAIMAAPDSMRLNLTTYWHQDSIYNMLCPVLDTLTGDTTIVGCVATAISQIMYYWQWPNTGVGTGSTKYYWQSRTTWDTEPLITDPGIPAGWATRLDWIPTGGGNLRMNGRWDYSLYVTAWYLSTNPAYQNALTNLYNRLTQDSTTYNANFGTTNYQMNLLQDSHIPPPDAGDNAVARLCYHAGIAVDMDYGVDGSGAQSDSVEHAIEDHFRYDDDATYIAQDADTMVHEIQWLRPVYFRGRTPSDDAGHAWIVIGYNKLHTPAWQFLMNLGWGTGPAWYMCDSIPDNYNSFQKHTIMIAPENVVKFVGNIDNGDGSPDNPYWDIEEANNISADNTTWIFKAGSDNRFSSDSLVIDNPHTLKGRDATIQGE